METVTRKKGIFLTQRKYVLDLLKETGKLEAAPSNSPMIVNPYLELDNKIPFEELPEHIRKKVNPKKLEPFEYPDKNHRLIGKLNYLTITRPDVTFSVSFLSQFMGDPTVGQWEALEHVLRYLKQSPGRGILYKNYGHTDIECFCDADHAGCKKTRRSTTGYCVFVGGNLVSWRSKKQGVASHSSAEAEYRAMASGVYELLWIQHVLKELKQPVNEPMRFYCNNKATISIAHNQVQHDQTKHVEIDRHYIKEKVEAGIMTLTNVRSSEQIGDMMTKSLARPTFERFRSKLEMLDICSPA